MPVKYTPYLPDPVEGQALFCMHNLRLLITLPKSLRPYWSASSRPAVMKA